MEQQRENLLSKVTLASGELAWPVAKARGLSETLFRKRIKQMSADEAVNRPVVVKGGLLASTTEQRESFETRCANLRRYRGEARRSLAIAERSAYDAGLAMPQTERAARQRVFQAAKNGEACHDITASDYAGVCVETVGERLAVKLDGSTFVFQKADASGSAWATEFAYYYLADVVARLAGRHVWPLAASVLPSYEKSCLDMLAAGDLPLLFISDGGSLRWLVRSDEAGW